MTLYSSDVFAAIKRPANGSNSSSAPLTKSSRLSEDNSQIIKTIDQWDSATTNEIIDYMSPAFGVYNNKELKDFLYTFMYGINSKVVGEDTGIPHIVLARICSINSSHNIIEEYKIPKIFCSGESIKTLINRKIKSFLREKGKKYFESIALTELLYTVSSGAFENEANSHSHLAHSERAVGAYLLSIKKFNLIGARDIIIQIRTSLPMCEYCQFFWHGEACIRIKKDDNTDKVKEDEMIRIMCYGKPCFYQVTKEDILERAKNGKNKKIEEYNEEDIKHLNKNLELFNEIKSKINCHDIKVHVSRNMHKYPYNDNKGVNNSILIF